jgi:hypothetical protein
MNLTKLLEDAMKVIGYSPQKLDCSSNGNDTRNRVRCLSTREISYGYHIIGHPIREPSAMVKAVEFMKGVTLQDTIGSSRKNPAYRMI